MLRSHQASLIRHVQKFETLTSTPASEQHASKRVCGSYPEQLQEALQLVPDVPPIKKASGSQVTTGDEVKLGIPRDDIDG